MNSDMSYTMIIFKKVEFDLQMKYFTHIVLIFTNNNFNSFVVDINLCYVFIY